MPLPRAIISGYDSDRYTSQHQKMMQTHTFNLVGIARRADYLKMKQRILNIIFLSTGKSNQRQPNNQEQQHRREIDVRAGQS